MTKDNSWWWPLKIAVC